MKTYQNIPFDVGDVDDGDIPLDANGKPVGYSLADFSEKLLDKLSAAYGVDFRTL